MDLDLFVQKVKYYCERASVKPTVACRESGAGERLYENVKRGSVPSIEKVQLLARYLGVTTSELLGEAGESVPRSGTPPDVLMVRDSAVRVDRCETLRLSVAEVEIALAYRRADQRARDMVDLALAPFAKKGSGAAG